MGPEDPDNPKTWSRLYRWYITMASALLLLNATFASSAPEGIVTQLIEEFGFGTEVATLTIAIFIAGYCVGPLMWGPLSEEYGRKPIFIFSFIFYTGFQVGCALSQNTASIIIFRLLSGIFAAAPLANSGAVIADIWDADTRGKAMAMFSLAPFAGPSIGPTVSGFMSVAGVSWRWVFWLLTMFAGACIAIIVFTIPETYTPILLVRRAEKLRKESGESRYWAPMERRKLAIGQHIKTVVGRPFVILAREPMLIAITVYMSFVYGVIYLLFEAYPIVFGRGHGFNSGFVGLTFLPIPIGGAIGVLVYLLYFNPRYEAAMAKYAPAPVPPEYRMEPAIYAAPIYALSFFWFGWTSYPHISYWAPLAAGIPMSIGIVWIFLGLLNYTIDAYLFVAASALSAATVVRSIFGAVFPLFATQMYDAMNPRWASTLLGCVALLLMPIPLVLRRYGPHLRRKSKYAPTGKPRAPKESEKKGADAA
ncbi:MFS general substrate transporter [Dichomitus squalens LYAD-421 SS1]|uniref:MFS general substrate transporter n=1 Tax=Dichomitus squalens (strain LYAD-421) TaxID=732165 RepID=R7SLE2_DICSQ|nr:MFS general substrate transporter [Dichomitus squalens LYAD-421 SS1]EJF55857.1 MFS general substrate transporter [Dichomitus squalens LYAD-421 SS1]